MKTPLMIQSTKSSINPRITLKQLKKIVPNFSSVAFKEKRQHQIRDLFRESFEIYCQKNPVEEHKLGVIRSIMACKTGELGYTLSYCPECQKIDMYASACGDRNCPVCGNVERRKWTEIKKAEMIPGIPYYHLVFTLPHELTGIICQNQKPMLDLLFSSVKDTILTLCRDKLKMTPGILMILHSFGSNLSAHYHLHVLVSGGGLALDRKSFIRPQNKGFFLPLDAITSVYRGKFMSGMKDLRKSSGLIFIGDQKKYLGHQNWKGLLDTCYNKKWNVEIRRYNSPDDKAGSSKSVPATDSVIEYFANYSNRTAISEDRIISYDKDTVTFIYKKYDGPDYTKEKMTLSIDEFIRRYLTHILPKGFQKIRSAGILAGSVRKKNLELIFRLLGKSYSPSPVADMKGIELIKYFYGTDLTKCSKCKRTIELLIRINDWESPISIRDA